MKRTNNKILICEWVGCKAHATQADTYQNMWLCDNHYSYIARINDDYQSETFIEYEDITIRR